MKSLLIPQERLLKQKTDKADVPADAGVTIVSVPQQSPQGALSMKEGEMLCVPSTKQNGISGIMSMVFDNKIRHCSLLVGAPRHRHRNTHPHHVLMLNWHIMQP